MNFNFLQKYRASSEKTVNSFRKELPRFNVFQLSVFLIAYRLKPLVALFAASGNVRCNVLKPRVLLRTVPVLDTFRNVDNVARIERHGGLAPFLIPAASRQTNQNLPRTVVNVPVVAAARLKRYVRHWQNGPFAFLQVFGYQWVEITVANEILRVIHVRVALCKVAFERISLAVEPGAEFINQLLTVAHIHHAAARVYVGPQPACRQRANHPRRPETLSLPDLRARRLQLVLLCRRTAHRH